MSSNSEALRACVFPLLEALGWQGDRNILSEYLGDASPGTPGEFRNVLAALRFGSRAASCKPAALPDASLPCLFLDRAGHPRCLLRRRGDGAYFLYDGVSRDYRVERLLERRGTAFAFFPLAAGAESVLDSRSDWLWIVGSRFKAHLGASLGLSLVLGVLSLLYPILISLLYGQMTIRGNEAALFNLGLGTLLFIAADSGFRFLRAKLLSYASLRSGSMISSEVFRRLLAFQSSFTESASTEAQIRRVKDLRTVADFISGSALAALFDLPFVAVMLIWLVSAGGSVALVPGLGLLAFIAASLIAYPAVKRRQAAAAAARTERMDLAAAILAGAEDIAAAGMAEIWRAKYRAGSSRAAAASYAEAQGSASIMALSGFFVSAGGLATLYAGVRAVLEHRMPASALVAAMMLVWRVLGIARSTFVVLNQLDSLMGSLRQLRRFMALPQETRPTAFTLPSRPPEGDLQFRDVSFRYGPEGYPALYGVSFTAPRGAVTVLEGHQGAGKTTALKLSLGLYRPQVGRVLLGPFNIQQAEPLQLRRSIAYVPEFPMLLSGSARKFIRGSSGVSDETIRRISEELGLLAALDEQGWNLDTEFPEADEAVPPDLARLAAICRAVARKAPLYLFDEQRFVQERHAASLATALRKLADAGAAVLIAARVDARPAGTDAVIRLDSGRVVRLLEGGAS